MEKWATSFYMFDGWWEPSNDVIKRCHQMPSFDGYYMASHHLMAFDDPSMVSIWPLIIWWPSMTPIIWWLPSFDGFHHLMAGSHLPSFDHSMAPIIWWLPSFDGTHHFHSMDDPHHLMAAIIWWLPSFDGSLPPPIIRSFDGSHHLMAAIIWWLPSFDGTHHYHSMATIIRWYHFDCFYD